MSFDSEKLLTELDQPRFIDWAVELKNHKEGLAFLIEAVRGDRLNHNQFLNALRMLFRLAFPDDTSEVLQTLVNLGAHPDITIRSEAVRLAIGLLQTSANLKTPLLFSDKQERAVRDAMSRGLTTKVANLAKKFFAI